MEHDNVSATETNYKTERNEKMKSRSALIESCLAAVLSLLTLPALCGPVPGGDYYTEPQVYQMRPNPAKEMALDCIGATGIKARFYPGVVLKVEGFTEKSPAEGKLKVGEIISGVNGVELKGINPLVALGEALTAAEATDGRMVFDVKASEDVAARKVTVMIPVLGKYSDTWPLGCEKSKKIIKAAAEYYAYDAGFRENCFNDKSEGGGMPSALACLFLLSTGDDKYLPVVKAYFANFPKDVSKIGDHTWNNGYNGVACAEYYLRTGDKEVLPILQYYCDNAKERQFFECGWNHWGRGIGPEYVAGGLMNPAGLQVLTTLLLGKACGVNVDEKTLLGALKFTYRFAGHGTVPYGDHRGEGGLGSNGKDGMAAAAMRVAMNADGNTERYEMAMKCLSMSTLTSYPIMIRGHGDEGRGDGIWRGTASSYMLDCKPADYHAVMKRMRWFYDLSRHPSGAIGMAGCQRFDDVGSGAGVAMGYTAPLKTLAITGAPRSKHAKNFTMPKTIWGNEADLAFLSIENAKRFSKYGKEDPIEVPFHTFGNAYSGPDGDLTGVPREEILKNVYHKRYLIRAQAAKALRVVGNFDDLEKLLGDRDPRVRRAALDGMCDYGYWFHLGKAPMKPEQFTPGMVEAVVKILRNKKEALWVTDGALTVMSCMPPETVGENLDLVMPWTSHADWWLRQSAFSALSTAARDPKLVAQVLPTMLEMLSREDHTMPRNGMVQKLNRLLKDQGPASPVGQQILTAHLKAVQERKIIPGPRAGEGGYDVRKSVDVIARESPGQILEVAKTLRGRFSDIEDANFWKIICDPPRGLLHLLDKQTEASRKELTDILYDDFAPELRRRLKTATGEDKPQLVNALLATIRLKKEIDGWQPIGTPAYPERVWRYYAFNPLNEADQLDPRKQTRKRLRTITMPEGMANWYAPGFDVSKWASGKAPIGVGEFSGGGYSRPKDWRPEWNTKTRYTTQTQQGDTEFLLMRTTFNLDRLDYDQYRLRVLTRGGYHVYLNGHKIHTYIWFQFWPEYTAIDKDEIAKYLKKGENTLAVFSNSAIEKHRGEEEHRPLAQTDVYIEGLRFKDLEDPRKEDLLETGKRAVKAANRPLKVFNLPKMVARSGRSSPSGSLWRKSWTSLRPGGDGPAGNDRDMIGHRK